MISPSLDHLPFMLGGADVSVTIEQQIPLSGIRGHRRASALADVDRLRAEANRDDAGRGRPGRQRVPDAAGAPAYGGARRRADRLCPRRRHRGERALCERHRAAVRRAARRSRSGAARSARARARRARCAAPRPCSTRASRWTRTLPVPPLAPLALAQPVPSWSAIKSGVDVAPGTGRRPRRDRARRGRRAGDARHVPTDGDDPHRAGLHDGRGARLDGDGRRQPADLARQAARRRRRSAGDARDVRSRPAGDDPDDRRRRRGRRQPAAGRARSAGGAHERRAAARAHGDRTGRRGLRRRASCRWSASSKPCRRSGWSSPT